MHPGSVQSFYRARRTLRIAACIAPLLLLGSAWWVVDRVVLTPRVPPADAPPDECVRFILHEKGLPKLQADPSKAFLDQQIRRLENDSAFRAGFLAILRRSTPEQQEAFRAHLFAAIKPRMLDEVRRYHELESQAQADYLDRRLIEYKRLGHLFRGTRLDHTPLGGSFFEPSTMVRLLTNKTPLQEQALALAYFAAMDLRWNQILEDPALRKQFEPRLIEEASP